MAPPHRARVAVLVVMPVAALDAATLPFYGSLFPAPEPGTPRLFAAWALLAYLDAFATAIRR
jgi:hypothetical protein